MSTQRTVEDLAREATEQLLQEGERFSYAASDNWKARFAALIRDQALEEFVVDRWIISGDLGGHAPRAYGYALHASDGYTQEQVNERLAKDPTLTATALYVRRALKAKG